MATKYILTPAKHNLYSSSLAPSDLPEAWSRPVRGELLGEGLDPPGIALLAQHVVVEGVAAAALLLAGQQQVAVHAPVAVDVEAPVERDHPDGLLLLLAGAGHDGLLAHAAPRREPPVEVLDAVDLVGGVHGEGDAVEALVADEAGEAGGVVGLAGGPEDPVQDGLAALAALLQGVRVVLLAQRLVVGPAVEGLAQQQAGALGAGEALDVVEAAHGAAARALAHDPQAAGHAGAEVVRVRAVGQGLVVGGHPLVGDGGLGALGRDDWLVQAVSGGAAGEGGALGLQLVGGQDVGLRGEDCVRRQGLPV